MFAGAGVFPPGITEFMFMYGWTFLRATLLQPLLSVTAQEGSVEVSSSFLVENPSLIFINLLLQINSSKLGPDDDVKANAKRLTNMTGMVVSSVWDNVELIPL